MKNLVEFIVHKLVDNPDDVEVKEISGDKTVVFELRVHQEDLGKVIGKQGKTAKAIRTVLSAASVKEGKRSVLEIID